LTQFEAADSLAKETVNALAIYFDSEVEPFFCVCVFTNEVMTAADVVHASKVALINFNPRHVVVACDSVRVFSRISLDIAPFKTPKLSIFKDISLLL